MDPSSPFQGKNLPRRETTLLRGHGPSPLLSYDPLTNEYMLIFFQDHEQWRKIKGKITNYFQDLTSLTIKIILKHSISQIVGSSIKKQQISATLRENHNGVEHLSSSWGCACSVVQKCVSILNSLNLSDFGRLLLEPALLTQIVKNPCFKPKTNP